MIFPHADNKKQRQGWMLAQRGIGDSPRDRVFASCEELLDLQAWLFGVGLHPEAVKLTSVAKATIYKYHFGLECPEVDQAVLATGMYEADCSLEADTGTSMSVGSGSAYKSVSSRLVVDCVKRNAPRLLLLATIGRDASADPVVLNPNIDIPKYDGTEDPRPWIESLEEIGFLYHWAEYIISRYAAMNMIGSAKTWLDLHKISFTSWEHFKSRLIQDFASDANKEELKMRLNRMQQWNDPAIRFAEDILVLCNKVDPQMEEENKINWVIGGLKKEYSFALCLNPPKNTNELLRLCKKMDLFENNYQERIEKSKALYNGPRSPRSHHKEQWKNAPSFRRPDQNTSKPQAPAPRYYQNTPSPRPPLRGTTRTSRCPRVKFVRIVEEDPSVSQDKSQENLQMDERKDYTRPRLYADVLKDVYPIPRIDDLMDTLQGSKYFSAIDLKSGYWQVEIEERDKEKTAFTTAHGLYEFNVMPFGLCNAPATFERNMDNVLGNLRWQICLCYLDDVIIYSSDFPTHIKRLESVLRCYSESNLKLNAKKCRFAFEELEILGHITNQEGIKPAKYNIKAVRDFPQPKKAKEVQSFLGMCSYYRKFIKDFSVIADPLTSLIRKNVQFIWTGEQEEAFQNLKKALMNPPILGHFDPNAATCIHTDASNIGLGATLIQIIGGEEKEGRGTIPMFIVALTGQRAGPTCRQRSPRKSMGMDSAARGLSWFLLALHEEGGRPRTKTADPDATDALHRGEGLVYGEAMWPYVALVRSEKLVFASSSRLYCVRPDGERS
ncbi:K02A2.6-like [Cordylochernes scorpioides]|uniref:K02A2.6-like n=1 Tax=Cordylochernes scorpioides TaxID=51811 RepID=A0ABY6KWV6_9ARAC|nr:K02A2.6-like [Cordylochernes scorpioides]